MRATLLVLAVLLVGSAQAHFRLDSPTPRSTSDSLKTLECGRVPVGTTRTTIAGGSAVTISVTETVLHPGYYTVAYSVLNEKNFQEHELATNLFPKDTIQGHTQGETHTTTVTVPNVQCETCILQVRQYMAETKTYYYSCADVEFTGPRAPCPVNNGTECSSTSAGTCMAGFCVCNDGYLGDACQTYSPVGVGGGSGSGGDDDANAAGAGGNTALIVAGSLVAVGAAGAGIVYMRNSNQASAAAPAAAAPVAKKTGSVSAPTTGATRARKSSGGAAGKQQGARKGPGSRGSRGKTGNGSRGSRGSRGNGTGRGSRGSRGARSRSRPSANQA